MIDHDIEEALEAFFGNRGCHRFFLSEAEKKSASERPSFLNWVRDDTQESSSLKGIGLSLNDQVRTMAGFYTVLVVQFGHTFPRDIHPSRLFSYFRVVGMAGIEYHFTPVFVSCPARVQTIINELRIRANQGGEAMMASQLHGTDIIGFMRAGNRSTMVVVGAAPIPETRPQG